MSSSYEEFYRIYQTQSQNASAKTSLLITDLFQSYAEYTKQQSDNWIKLKDVMHVTHGGIVAKPNSFYFEMIEKTVHSLIDTGVMNYLIENHIGRKLTFRKPENEPKVLSINDLLFGFNIWLGFCVLSVICFFVEYLCWPGNRLKMKR